MTDLAPYTVTMEATIREAMEKIDKNKHRAVVVVDDERRVIGMVSDGDIRRAFLKNMLPIAPVRQIMNMNPQTTRERNPAKLAKLASQKKVTLLPVVSEDNRLLDVILAFEPFEPNDATPKSKGRKP